MPRVEGDFYAVEAPEALGERLDRFHDIMRAIEARGLGSPRAKALARRWADRAARNEPWYRVLSTAKDIHEHVKSAEPSRSGPMPTASALIMPMITIYFVPWT